jgi:hypothetical protein
MLYDLDEMRRRLAVLDAERTPLVALIAAAEQYEGTVGKTIRDSGNITVRVAPRRNGTVAAQTEELALELAEAKQRPVPTREVVAEMEARGLPLPDKNVINVVSARLSNSDRVKGRRDMGWWPVEKPWPDKGESRVGSLQLDDDREGGADVSAGG